MAHYSERQLGDEGAIALPELATLAEEGAQCRIGGMVEAQDGAQRLLGGAQLNDVRQHLTLLV